MTKRGAAPGPSGTTRTARTAGATVTRDSAGDAGSPGTAGAAGIAGTSGTSGASGMELRQLRTFEAVVGTGSVTEAAVRLGLAPSSVSQAVRTLEQSLGVELFERLPRGMRLTPAGERLLVWSRRLLEQAEQARREVVDAGRQRTAVRLGALESIAAAIVPGILERLAARRPELAVDVTSQADRSALLASVAAGELDAALVLDAGDSLGGLGFPLPSGTDLEFLDLEPVPLMLVAAPGHRHATADRLAPADLRGERLLVNVSSACSFALAADRLCGPGVERVHAGSVAVMRAWARRGMGIALLPSFAVADEVASGALAALPLRTPTLHLRLIWPPSRATHPPTRALLYAASG
ncbi:LysR family transcriptional regulator [Actinacidiphila yanglinensis]|nr:LysR family transcriptional regulator [Actinacidiphila yanglinensis]